MFLLFQFLSTLMSVLMLFFFAINVISFLIGINKVGIYLSIHLNNTHLIDDTLLFHHYQFYSLTQSCSFMTATFVRRHYVKSAVSE